MAMAMAVKMAEVARPWLTPGSRAGDVPAVAVGLGCMRISWPVGAVGSKLSLGGPNQRLRWPVGLRM
jgi:hypothetical protein